MSKEPKVNPFAVTAVVLLFAAFVLLLVGWRVHAFDPWFHAHFPKLYPVAFGLLGLFLAVKIAFWPSARDLDRGALRWLTVLVLVAAAVTAFVYPSMVFFWVR